MKPNTNIVKMHFQALQADDQTIGSQNALLENPYMHSKNATLPMREQAIAPPAHVWDKIERILDEQDKQVQHFKDVLNEQKTSIAKNAKKPVYLAIGVTLLGGLLWYYL